MLVLWVHEGLHSVLQAKHSVEPEPSLLTVGVLAKVWFGRVVFPAKVFGIGECM